MVQTLAELLLIEPAQVWIVFRFFGFQFHYEVRDFFKLEVCFAPGIGLLIIDYGQLFSMAVACKIAIIDIELPCLGMAFVFLDLKFNFKDLEDKGGVVD